MSDEIKNLFFTSAKHLLKPIIRVAIRHGVTFGELSEVVKSTYVEVARDDFPLPGKKASDSRIAILTGLSRKQVRKLRETPEDILPFSADSVNRATRVLSGWHQDTDFLDAKGRPQSLPMEGGVPSFDALVKRYSGDMPTRAMLEELIRIKAVEKTASGEVAVQQRSYIPGNDNPAGIKMMGTALHDLASTIDYNIDPERSDSARFQRMVLTDRLDPKAFPLFQRYLEEHGQKFLEMLDDWLTSHELPEDASDADGIKTGFGIYFILQDSTDEGEDNE